MQKYKIFAKYCKIVFLFSWIVSLYAHKPSDWKFIENKGQLPAQVKSAVKFSSLQLFIEENAFTYVLYNQDSLSIIHPNPEKRNIIIPAHAFKQVFVGTNQGKEFVKSEESPFYENYFIGNDKSKWASKVRRYKKVTFVNYYDNIDLIWKYEGLLKYEFRVKPSGNTKQIRWEYTGVKSPEINDKGKLVISTNAGYFIEQKPYAYQIINDRRVEVKCSYRKFSDGTFGFYFPKGYNKKYELVIDPTLVFATYSGSTADNWGFTATFDRAGNMFIGGMATGLGYPVTVGAFQTVFAGGVNYNNQNIPIFYPMDIAIMKLNDTGTQILWATYLGGSNNEQPHSMIVNNKNELYILGATRSSDFPTTTTAYDTTFNGGSVDIIISKLSADGSQLLASTYLGGSDLDGVVAEYINSIKNPLYYFYADDGRGEIKLTSAGEPVIISSTASINFPTTSGAYDSTFGGNLDAVLVKLTENLDSLIFSTYIGDTGYDAGYGIDFDKNGDILAVGGTTSPNFPITVNAYDSLIGAFSEPEGWLAIFTSDASTIKNSTFFGTDNYDQIYFAQFSEDSIFFVGHTAGNIPMLGSVWGQPNRKQFIGCINKTLDTLLLLTTFGKQSSQEPLPVLTVNAFMVDNCNKVYFSGWGGSWLGKGFMDNLYVSPSAIQSTTDGNDFYIIVFDKDLANVYYATYIGGSSSHDHVDGGTSRFDKHSIVYQNICGGCGGFSDFPTTPGAVSNVNASSNCNNLAIKLDLETTFIPRANAEDSVIATTNNCAPFTIQFTNKSKDAASYFWDFGDGTTSTQVNPVHTYVLPDTYNVMLVAFPNNTLPTLCTDNDTFYLEINIPPSPTGNFSDSAICDSGKVFFFSTINSDTLDVFWDFGDGNTSKQENPIHYYNAPGFYNVSLTIKNTYGCAYTVSKNIFAYKKPAFNVSMDTLPCSLEITFATDSNSWTTNFWDFGDGDTSIFSTTTHSYNSPGNYTITLTKTLNNTCSYSGQFNINIDPKSVADFSVVFDTCQRIVRITNNSKFFSELNLSLGDGTMLNNFSTYTHYYDFIDTTFNITLITNASVPTCSDTMTQEIKIPYMPVAKFVLQGDECDLTQFLNAEGSVADSFLWFVNGNLIAQDSALAYTFPDSGEYTITLITLQPNNPICYSDTLTIDTLLGNTSYAAFSYEQNCKKIKFYNHSYYDSTYASGTIYLWDFGDGTTSTQENPTHTYNSFGDFTITLTVRPNTKCEKQISRTITIKELPQPKFKLDIEPCSFVPIFVNTTEEPANFYWEINGQKYFADSIPVEWIKTGQFLQVSLVLYDSVGCSKTKDTSFTVSKSLWEKIFVPNAFTPNGDGLNDIFEIRGTSSDCVKRLRIYDRWGNLIYETQSFPLRWDGSNKTNGKPANEGVYVFVLENKNGEKRAGTITLLR